MLNSEEETFLVYWEQNRDRQKTSMRPLLAGLSAGLAIGIGVIIVLETGWFERANMVANSRLSSVVFVLAILVTAVFMGVIYRKFRWEMMEQRYLELRAAKNKAENQAAKQP